MAVVHELFQPGSHALQQRGWNSHGIARGPERVQIEAGVEVLGQFGGGTRQPAGPNALRSPRVVYAPQYVGVPAARAGNSRAASIAMIAITTSSSMSVNADSLDLSILIMRRLPF